MNDHQREQRRAKKLAKHKKRRENASRPARSPGDVARDPSRGRAWPVGEAWVTQGWDTPGAKVSVLVSREDAGGSAVVAEFVLDRSGPGVVRAEAVGGLRTIHVQGRVARLSELANEAMIEVAAGLAAELVREAAERGTTGPPDGYDEAAALLGGIASIDPGVPFGADTGDEETRAPGLIQRVRSWFGG